LIVQKSIVQSSLEIVVEDRGPGVPPKEAGKIFDPFVRGELSVRRQVPGSGLGLHLVRRIAGVLGGTVKLESPYKTLPGMLQQGCRFTVEIPFPGERGS
jgi:signal transduction histidine kinase